MGLRQIMTEFRNYHHTEFEMQGFLASTVLPESIEILTVPGRWDAQDPPLNRLHARGDQRFLDLDLHADLMAEPDSDRLNDSRFVQFAINAGCHFVSSSVPQTPAHSPNMFSAKLILAAFAFAAVSSAAPPQAEKPAPVCTSSRNRLPCD